MRRVLTIALTLLLAVPNGIDQMVLAQAGGCADCQPGRLNRGWDVANGELKVCFKNSSDRAWGADEKTWFQEGMAWWTGLVAEQGKNISFAAYESKASNEDCSADSIKVEFVPPSGMVNGAASAEALGNATGRGGTILLNQDQVTPSWGRWTELGAHEFGHFFDLANVTNPGCLGVSVMAGSQANLPNPPCADRTGLTSRYRGGNVEDGGNNYDPTGGDCYDVYLTRYWFYWDGEQLWSSGWTTHYVGQYCGPPPY